MKLIFILAILFTISASNSNAQEITEFCIADFRTGLRRGMTKQDVVEKYGEPGKDIRYSLLTYVYTLNDSSEIEIGFTDGLLYATHRKEATVLEEIIKDIEVELTLDFIKKNIRRDMGANIILNTFGVPVEDIGSGLYIFLYALTDSSLVIIGCTNTNVLYANYCNQDGVWTSLFD